MTTKFVGVKEFRQNIAKFAKSSKKNNQRLVILSRNTPIFDVRPVSEDNFTVEFQQKIDQGLKDIKHGKVYSQKYVEKMFGL